MCSLLLMCFSPEHLLQLAPALMLCIQLLTAPGSFLTQVVIECVTDLQGLPMALPVHALQGGLFVQSLTWASPVCQGVRRVFKRTRTPKPTSS